MSIVWTEEKIKRIENECEFQFIRSSGPGGQNVNKVSSCCVLRWSLAPTKVFSEFQKSRLFVRLKLTLAGDIVIRSDRFRDQERNTADALGKLMGMIDKALFVEKKRVATKPTKGSQRRRIEDKKKSGQTKVLRQKVRAV